MIDIHIIPTPGFEANFAAMLQKLQHPKITVHPSEHIVGNLLEARWIGYNKGSAPYVSFVDGDDAVLDISWIDRALHILDNYPHVVCVYPRWKATHPNKPDFYSPIHQWSPEMHVTFASQPLPHHLSIMRRDPVIELIRIARENVSGMIKNPERYVTSGLARYGLLVPFDDVAYEWRLRPGTSRTLEDPPDVLEFVHARMRGDAKAAKLVNQNQPWLA